MSNSSIPVRIQWHIPSNQYNNSDTDSTLSDLDESSQSVLEDNKSEKEKKIEDFSELKETKIFHSSFQKPYVKAKDKTCDIILGPTCGNGENNTSLTETGERSWNEEDGLVKDNNERTHEEIQTHVKIGAKHCVGKKTKSVQNLKELDFCLTELVGEKWDKEENFETNTCLTEIIGRSWSEEINDIVKCNNGKTNKVEHNEDDTKICTSINKNTVCNRFLQNNNETEFCLTEILEEKWCNGINKDESVLGELSQEVVNSVSSLLFDIDEEKTNEKIEINYVNEIEQNKDCDNKSLSINNELLIDCFKNVSTDISENANILEVDSSSVNDTLEVDNNAMDVENEILESFVLDDDNTGVNLTGKNDELLDLTLNLQDICTDKIINNYDISISHTANVNIRTSSVHIKNNSRHYLNNQTVQNPPKRLLKPKVFPEPLYSKIHGVPPREPVAKRKCSLKNENIFKAYSRNGNKGKEEYISPERKKRKVIPKCNKKVVFPQCRKISDNKKKTKVKRTKLKKIENVEVFVTIGVRLDDIRTRITKWMNGETDTAVSRIDAVNMLDYVRNVQMEIKSMYQCRGRKPAPAKKLIDAAALLELQIGKAISDADLHYKTEKLTRLQLLKYKNKDETDSNEFMKADSDSDSESSNDKSDYSNNKIETERNTQKKPNYHKKTISQHDKQSLINSLTELTLKKTVHNTNKTINSNLKSILKNKCENTYNKRKQLNFSDDVEYFEISQIPVNNIDENINNKIDISGDIEMLEDETVMRSKSDDNTLCASSALLCNRDRSFNNIVVDSSRSGCNHFSDSFTDTNTSKTDSGISQVNQEEFESQNYFSKNRPEGNKSYSHGSSKTTHLCQNNLVECNHESESTTGSGKIYLNQNKSPEYLENQIEIAKLFNSRTESIERVLSDLRQNVSPVTEQLCITNSLKLPSESNMEISNIKNANGSNVLSRRTENASKPASIGTTDSNLSNQTISQQPTSLENRYKNSTHPDYSKQNKKTVLNLPKQKTENNRIMESLSSGIDVNTPNSDFSVPQPISVESSTSFFSEKEDNWHDITIMDVKAIRIKSAAELHSVKDFNFEDWF